MEEVISELLNSKKSAKVLNLSESTLAKMRVYGTGPAYLKLGRRVLYRREDLAAWLVQRRFTSTSEYDKDER